jgi:BirA family biotin operon repressor/biotin-[acetyl-CoA-carboxylase] ligase
MRDNEFEAAFELISMLADGKVHSGRELGVALGVSRAAVWKRIGKLAGLGVEVIKVRSRGYKLPKPVEFLDAGFLQHNLSTMMPGKVLSVEVVNQIDSTNLELLRRERSKDESAVTCLLAEQQTSGRGRRGKAWYSPLGENVYLSILWQTELSLTKLNGLSLALGVAIATMLSDVFGINAKLKWPNDVLVKNKKIAGILVDVDGAIEGPLRVVVGVGLNVSTEHETTEPNGHDWTGVIAQSDRNCSRTDVALNVISRLLLALQEFERLGFRAFRQRWIALDAYTGMMVQITSNEHSLAGTDLGVDENGALVIDVDGVAQAISSGEVSLRVRP